MKLVIIPVPSDIDINDIRQAAAEFAECIELPTLKVNILEEGDIQIESASEIIKPIVANICAKCINPNPLFTVANFWRLISTGDISKGDLEKLMAHRNATKAYLKNRKMECFLALFDDALKRM